MSRASAPSEVGKHSQRGPVGFRQLPPGRARHVSPAAPPATRRASPARRATIKSSPEPGDASNAPEGATPQAPRRPQARAPRAARFTGATATGSASAYSCRRACAPRRRRRRRCQPASMTNAGPTACGRPCASARRTRRRRAAVAANRPSLLRAPASRYARVRSASLLKGRIEAVEALVLRAFRRRGSRRIHACDAVAVRNLRELASVLQTASCRFTALAYASTAFVIHRA